MTGGVPSRLADCRLYLIASVMPDDPRERATRLSAIVAAVAGGAEAVQLRMKDGATEQRRDWLRRLRRDLPPGTPIVVNDDLDAVFDADGSALADGLHLGREDAARLTAAGTVAAGLAEARCRLGPERALGTSTRTLDEVRVAVDAGADHLGFGAMAVSPTKSDTHPASRAELTRCVQAYPGVPIFPIGGLGPDNLDRVLETPCRRAAVGSAILDAPDPREAARRIRARLDSAATPGGGLPA